MSAIRIPKQPIPMTPTTLRSMLLTQAENGIHVILSAFRKIWLWVYENGIQDTRYSIYLRGTMSPDMFNKGTAKRFSNICYSAVASSWKLRSSKVTSMAPYREYSRYIGIQEFRGYTRSPQFALNPKHSRSLRFQPKSSTGHAMSHAPHSPLGDHPVMGPLSAPNGRVLISCD